jgi:hypothetical protein
MSDERGGLMSAACESRESELGARSLGAGARELGLCEQFWRANLTPHSSQSKCTQTARSRRTTNHEPSDEQQPTQARRTATQDTGQQHSNLTHSEREHSHSWQLATHSPLTTHSLDTRYYEARTPSPNQQHTTSRTGVGVLEHETRKP